MDRKRSRGFLTVAIAIHIVACLFAFVALGSQPAVLTKPAPRAPTIDDPSNPQIRNIA